MAQITINGVALPDENLLPYGKTKSDIHSSDSGRGETGVMNITYVRENVRKLEIELHCIKGSALKQIYTAFETKPLSVEIIGIDGEPETLSCYKGDISETKVFEDMSGTKYFNVVLSMTQL